MDVRVDTDNTAAVVPRRFSKLWLEDGNIVIQAGNSQFRVLRSTLAACSPVFQDMFSIPQPSDSDAELVDGCPLVRLPDSAEDVKVFLKAIFTPGYFMPFPAETKYATVQGCLRLSHKYEVEYLRQRALVHLSSRYRTTLDEWDAAGFYQSDDPTDCTLSEIMSWPTPTKEIYLISVIQLAREVDAVWILPNAFYSLSEELGAHIGFCESYCFVDEISTTLNAQDRRAFLRGHTLQTQASATTILGSFLTPFNDCKKAATCRKERFIAIDKLREMIREYPSIPLHVWDEDDWKLLDNTVCSSCLASLKRAHREARQSFWDGLPEMYGPPPWEELEKMRADAIGANWWRS